MDASTLHPRFEEPAVVAALAARWADGRRMRIEDALAPGLAERIADAALAHPFEAFDRHVSDIQCFFWRQFHPFAPGGAGSTFAPLAEVRRLLVHDLPALASAIAGAALHALELEGAVVDYYTRGSYLDTHTDQGARRVVAYVVGLTRERWPAEDGGHLEFLAPDEQTVIDRVAPGFGTIDLFCIYPLLRPHRVPLVTAPVTRLTINGWLEGELVAPGEA